MDVSLVALILFGAISFTLLAVAWIIRDVTARSTVAVGIGRLPMARDESVHRGLIGRLDLSFHRLMVESGLTTKPSAGFFLLFAVGLLFGGAALIWMNDPIAACTFFAIGFFAPIPFIARIRSKRVRQIQDQFPDTVDLMSRAVRAGESLDQAIALIGDQGPEPLAKEFRRCSKQLEMGLGIGAAMRSLVHRVRLLELRILATMLAVHRQTGGNLVVALERMSNVARDRLAYQRQLRATSAAGRMSAFFVALAGPLLFSYLFFFQKNYFAKLIDLPLGQMLLAIAVVLEIVGLFWIARMAKSDY